MKGDACAYAGNLVPQSDVGVKGQRGGGSELPAWDVSTGFLVGGRVSGAKETESGCEGALRFCWREAKVAMGVCMLEDQQGASSQGTLGPGALGL